MLEMEINDKILEDKMINHVYKLFGDFCRQYYKPSEYEHCKRVKNIVKQSKMYKGADKIDKVYIKCIALGHDIIEDGCVDETNLFIFIKELFSISKNFLDPELYKQFWDEGRRIFESIIILTRNNEIDQTYKEYINEIAQFKKDHGKNLPGGGYNTPDLAHLIKVADILDHLLNFNSLKPSLKKRYFSGLETLLQDEVIGYREESDKEKYADLTNEEYSDLVHERRMGHIMSGVNQLLGIDDEDDER